VRFRVHFWEKKGWVRGRTRTRSIVITAASAEEAEAAVMKMLPKNYRITRVVQVWV
jgi:hypothetical protein